jgi:prepilin-type N-terminal cleavage/methylation domain-containing protein/prepilin-type processing-associated H-X9-DG protein
MNYSPRKPKKARAGFTMMELLVAIAIVVALAAIAFTVSASMKNRANMARANQKIRDIGAAFVGYTADSGGLLPYEDSPGADTWNTAAKPENSEVWYNALPRSMGQPSVGDLAREPERFYQESYPLFLPGAPYPKSDKKLGQPYFAIGMNSRLQRKDENEKKEQGTLASILDPVRTVAFLERGMPGDKKTSPVQKGFDAGPKANARAFAARHNEKGVLLFVDGHTEVRAVTELIERGGQIPFPQDRVVWTRDPADDPN